MDRIELLKGKLAPHSLHKSGALIFSVEAHPGSFVDDDEMLGFVNDLKEAQTSTPSLLKVETVRCWMRGTL